MNYRDLCRVFSYEMHKYLIRVSKPGNTPEPRKDFSIDLLVGRLFEEVDELKEAIKQFKEVNTENLTDELLDVANFCMLEKVKLKLFN